MAHYKLLLHGLHHSTDTMHNIDAKIIQYPKSVNVFFLLPFLHFSIQTNISPILSRLAYSKGHSIHLPLTISSFSIGINKIRFYSRTSREVDVTNQFPLRRALFDYLYNSLAISVHLTCLRASDFKSKLGTVCFRCVFVLYRTLLECSVQ